MRKPRPIVYSLEEVIITRDETTAHIKYRDPAYGETGLVLGEKVQRMTDQEIIDAYISLAEVAKRLGRKALAEVAQIVRPETILSWHRRLIAQKSTAQRIGRPRRAARRRMRGINTDSPGPWRNRALVRRADQEFKLTLDDINPFVPARNASGAAPGNKKSFKE